MLTPGAGLLFCSAFEGAYLHFLVSPWNYRLGDLKIFPALQPPHPASAIDFYILVLLPKEKKENDAADFWRILQTDIAERGESVCVCGGGGGGGAGWCQEENKAMETAAGFSPASLGLVCLCLTGLFTQQDFLNNIPQKPHVPWTPGGESCVSLWKNNSRLSAL